MSRPSQFRIWLMLAAGLTLFVPGCASTSNTDVSMSDAGWMSSLKKKFTPKTEYAKIIQPTHTGEPSSQLFVAYGKLEESRKNVNKAHDAYSTALAKDPQSYEAILGLARLEQLAGRPETAEQGFLKAQAIAPGSPDVMTALGQFYAAQNRWDEAIALHRQAFQVEPTNTQLRYGLARVLTQAGRVDEGLAQFEESLHDNVANSTAAAEYNVGVILHEQGRFVEAEQHLLKATIHDPSMEQAQEWLDVVRRDKSRQQAIAAANSNAGRIQQASAQQHMQQPAASGVSPASHTEYSQPRPTANIQGVQPIQAGNLSR
ncbi:tetratricopeptide repeat protein [Symmachiella dynata]|uniref:tetratricopeptide repeat protein n=1 Tax=Symmachiella dynata TaxID=2527995 RepID=UPI0030EEFACF